MSKIKKINIGCGPSSRWSDEDMDRLDIIDFGQKYVGDIMTIDLPKYDIVIIHHVIEHINDTVALFNKLCDITNTKAIIDIRVPILPYHYAFIDPTHVKFIPSVDFFRYFTKDSPAGHCYSKQKFEIVKFENDRYEWELHVIMRKL